MPFRVVEPVVFGLNNQELGLVPAIIDESGVDRTDGAGHIDPDLAEEAAQQVLELDGEDEMGELGCCGIKHMRRYQVLAFAFVEFAVVLCIIMLSSRSYSLHSLSYNVLSC